MGVIGVIGVVSVVGVNGAPLSPSLKSTVSLFPKILPQFAKTKVEIEIASFFFPKFSNDG